MNSKIDWLTTYRVGKRLLKNPENTIFIFQFLHATNPPSLRKTYNRLLALSEADVVYSYEEVSNYFSSLSDRPENSVGKEVHQNFPNQEILLKISRRKTNDTWIEAKHPYSWLARRYRDTHDIWHTLTGYKAEIVGEMCLAMFSYTQTKSLGWLLISLIVLAYRGFRFSDMRLIIEAYCIGKSAKLLLAENYDKLLTENLEDARKRLNIRLPRLYHATNQD